MHDPIAVKPSRLDRSFRHVLAEHERAWCGAETARHAAKLIGSIRQGARLAQRSDVGQSAAEVVGNGASALRAAGQDRLAACDLQPLVRAPLWNGRRAAPTVAR